METSENCAPQLFIGVSNGTANSEDLSGRNMSSKIASSQSHLLMKKKSSPTPSQLLLLAGNSLNKTNNFENLSRVPLTPVRTVLPTFGYKIWFSSQSLVVLAKAHAGSHATHPWRRLWGLVVTGNEPESLACSSLPSNSTLWPCRWVTWIPLTERENLGANIGTFSEIQMLFMSCVFPDQINKHRKQSSRPHGKNIMCPRCFHG